MLAERRFTPPGMVCPVSSVMPDRITENLVMFIRQNDGALAKNRRGGEFKQLTDDEVRRIERIVAGASDWSGDAGAPEAGG